MVFLAILLGVIISLLIIAYIIYLKVISYFKKVSSSFGYTNSEIKEMIKEGEYNSKYRHKTISGMTDFIIPKICRDFPDFNKEVLFSKVEESLLNIFSSLSTNKVSNNENLKLIKNSLIDEIKENERLNRVLSYDRIKFHKHAIKDYENNHGALIITIESSLEYFYSLKEGNKEIVKNSDFPKQVAYITKFVYIYDIDKYEGENILGVNCPNCGAPIKTLGHMYCEYCGSGVKLIDLKSWYISSYKEK